MRQLSLFYDPLEHDCAVVGGRHVRGWRGRWLRRAPVVRYFDLHGIDQHAGGVGVEPAWCRVLCDPVRVRRTLVAHVRFDGSPQVGSPFGLVLVGIDLARSVHSTSIHAPPPPRKNGAADAIRHKATVKT